MEMRAERDGFTVENLVSLCALAGSRAIWASELTFVRRCDVSQAIVERFPVKIFTRFDGLGNA